MNRSIKRQTYAHTLLALAPICNALASSVTHDPAEARQLTVDVMLWAWHLHDEADSPSMVKKQLLTEMSRRIQSRKL